MSVYKDALGRIESQQEQVLDLLKERGDKGVANYELATVAMSYQRRIHELVELGYDIQVKHQGLGVYYYTLVGVRKAADRVRKPILDQIIQEINDNHGGSVDALELLDIVEKVGALVSHKGVAKADKQEVTA